MGCGLGVGLSCVGEEELCVCTHCTPVHLLHRGVLGLDGRRALVGTRVAKFSFFFGEWREEKKKRGGLAIEGGERKEGEKRRRAQQASREHRWCVFSSACAVV